MCKSCKVASAKERLGSELSPATHLASCLLQELLTPGLFRETCPLAAPRNRGDGRLVTEQGSGGVERKALTSGLGQDARYKYLSS